MCVKNNISHLFNGAYKNTIGTIKGELIFFKLFWF